MKTKNTEAPNYQEILSIEGMSCASCVGRVEKSLAKVAGVQQATVNLATERAWIKGDAQIQTSELIEAVKKAGYEAKLVEQDQSDQQDKKASEQNQLKRDLGLSALLSLPVFILAMGSHMIPAFHMWVVNNLGTQQSWLIQFVLTTLVLLFP